jgi:hypothetical protein
VQAATRLMHGRRCSHNAVDVKVRRPACQLRLRKRGLRLHASRQFRCILEPSRRTAAAPIDRLRLSISVVAMIGFYLPLFGSNRAASLGLLGAAVTTTVWHLMGDSYGIDNMYVALVTPAIVMLIARLFHRGESAALAQR